MYTFINQQHLNAKKDKFVYVGWYFFSFIPLLWHIKIWFCIHLRLHRPTNISVLLIRAAIVIEIKATIFHPDLTFSIIIFYNYFRSKVKIYFPASLLMLGPIVWFGLYALLAQSISTWFLHLVWLTGNSTPQYTQISTA